MPIIIDSWNFIRSEKSGIDDEDGDPLGSARDLISRLEEFQNTHNDPIIAVFDSSNEYLGLGYKNSRKLSVVAARDADSYIKRYIDNVPERQRRNLRVVSSDNGVFYYAKSAYAAPMRCEEFWKKIDSSR